MSTLRGRAPADLGKPKRRMTNDSAHEVLSVARSLLLELDVERVLEHVLEAARELTGAQQAVFGVLDDERTTLERFITAGIDDATGTAPGQTGTSSFLGAPVRVAGAPFGNLYLRDKQGGRQFSSEDEDALVLLSQFAGLALDHALRFTRSERRGEELQRTVDALDASMQMASALGGETDLDVILELIAKRGRALVCARALVIEHRRDDQFVVAAAAGDVPAGVVGRCVDLHASDASAAPRTMRSQSLHDESNRLRFERHGLGLLGFHASAGLVVPLSFRGEAHGVLVAVDRLENGPAFSDEDQRLLEAFATSAATAIATAQSVADDRRSERLAAAEQERAHWARELHDDTLQGLAALRLGLAAAVLSGDGELMAAAVCTAIEQLDADIAGLRSLIADLRPAALDELGPETAIHALAERAQRGGLEVDVDVDFAYEHGRRQTRLVEQLETAAYRIAQEALTNARKHGSARRVVLEVVEDDSDVRVTVHDDGCGFDPATATAGFGLVGMRERTLLLGGTLQVDSAPGRGTLIVATLPARRRSDEPASSDHGARTAAPRLPRARSLQP